MQLKESYFAALGSLRAHRLRAWLVILHLAVCVALVVAAAGMTQGLSSTMNKSINSFVCSLSVTPKTPAQAGANAQRSLRDTDVDALVTQADPRLISQIVPTVTGSAVLRSGTRDYVSQNVVGSSSGYLQLRLQQLAAGSVFSDQQYENKARVVLLGPKLVQYLFDGDNQRALNSTVSIGRHKFQVIGILGGDGQDGATALMPMTTARSFLFGGMITVQEIGALVTGMDQIGPAVANVQSILDREHYVKDADQRDFVITSYNYLVPFMNELVNVPFWFAAGASLALLLVGIFGLGHLMVVSAAERDDEIKRRIASGTRASRICHEFLLGAMLLAGLGAIIGVVLGIAAILVGQRVLPGVSPLYALGPPTIPVLAIVLAIAASLLVGLIAGVYPAVHAIRGPRGDRQRRIGGPGEASRPAAPEEAPRPAVPVGD